MSERHSGVQKSSGTERRSGAFRLNLNIDYDKFDNYINPRSIDYQSRPNKVVNRIQRSSYKVMNAA